MEDSSSRSTGSVLEPVYGPHGLVQYQFVVPPAATEVVRTILDLLLEPARHLR